MSYYTSVYCHLCEAVPQYNAAPPVSSFTHVSNNETLTLTKLQVFLPSIFKTIAMLINLSLTPMIAGISSCHDHSGMSLFCSMFTDGAEVSEIVSKLKSPGPDGISSRLLKLASPAVANTLARIFSISIESGTFYGEWKKANVVPIYKKGG